MKAPDKIFIHKKDLSYSEVKESDSDITFIRKDALLEWAKETNQRINTDEGEYSLGYMSAIIDLIDKIDSL